MVTNRTRPSELQAEERPAGSTRTRTAHGRESSRRRYRQSCSAGRRRRASTSGVDHVDYDLLKTISEFVRGSRSRTYLLAVGSGRSERLSCVSGVARQRRRHGDGGPDQPRSSVRRTESELDRRVALRSANQPSIRPFSPHLGGKEGSRQGARWLESLLDAGAAGASFDFGMGDPGVLRDLAQQVLHVDRLQASTPEAVEADAVALELFLLAFGEPQDGIGKGVVADGVEALPEAVPVRRTGDDEVALSWDSSGV